MASADGHSFPVDATAIMLFASAIGETNPIYYDEEYAASTPLGHVTAPPSFAVASAQWNPNYMLRGHRQIPAPPPSPGVEPEKPAAKAKGGPAGGGLGRALHGEQRFIYHKPMRPGMKLSVTFRPGKTWEKEGRRGGIMRFSETVSEYRDEAGELVTTAISVGIVTGKAVQG